MYRPSGSVYALKKSKEALMLALDKNKQQTKELLESAKTIDDLKKLVKKIETERDSYKNQTAALKMVIEGMSEEEENAV